MNTKEEEGLVKWSKRHGDDQGIDIFDFLVQSLASEAFVIPSNLSFEEFDNIMCS